MAKYGRRSAQAAQLVDRDDPGVLKLAGDLGFLDEPADQLGLVADGSSRTLTARSRPRSGSRPLSTTPMPPRPISPKSWSRSVGPCSAGTIPAVDASLAGTPVPASVSQGATSGTRPIDWASVDRMLSSAVPRVDGIP